MIDVLYCVYLKKRGKNLCIMKNLRFIDSLVAKLLEKKEVDFVCHVEGEGINSVTGEKIKFITRQTGF